MKTDTCATNPPAMQIVNVEDAPLRDAPTVRKWAWLIDAFDQLPEGKALLIQVPSEYIAIEREKSQELIAEARRKGRERDAYRNGQPEHIVWACERLRSQAYQQLAKHCKANGARRRPCAKVTKDYRRIAIFNLAHDEKLNLHEVSIEPAPPSSDAA